jgi:Fe-S cluster biogenesis protein NfuA
MQEKVQKIIEKMRPYVQMHGGDVELLDITDGTVKLKVSGACVGCSMANQTYNGILDGMIKEEVPEVKNVIFEN